MVTVTLTLTLNQGSSLVLEHLGLETFLERLGLVSILKVKRLGLESLENRTSQSRLGLEDITSRSRISGFVTLGQCIRLTDISGRK